VQAEIGVIPKRSLDLAEAALYVGGLTLLRRYERWRWLKPYVDAPVQIAEVIPSESMAADRHNAEGEPKRPD